MPGVLYDRDGNIIGTSKNIDSFITNKEGEIINPSTDELLQSIDSKLQELNQDKISEVSKESTLQEIRDKLNAGIIVSLSNPVQNVSVTSSVLPTGAATEATLSEIKNKIETTANGIKVDGSSVVQPVSVNSLPLPEGAAKDSTLTDGSQVCRIRDSNGLNITTSFGNLNVNIKQIDANIDLNKEDDEVRIYGSSDEPINTDSSGRLNVNIVSSVLPNNAATETTLSELNSKITGELALENGNLRNIKDTVESINSKIDLLAKQNTLSSIDAKLNTTSGGIKVDASGYTVPVTVSELPLPNGAATELTQGLIYDKISSIESNIATEYTLAQINQKLNNTSNGALKVDASQFPISANITSSVLPTGAAKDSTLKDGTQITKITDSNGNSIETISGSIKTTIVSMPNSNAGVDSIRIYGTNVNVAVPIAVDANGKLLLPADAATATKQDTANTYLNSINSILQNLSFEGDKLKVDASISIAPEVEVKNDFGNPVPVQVASLPLPSGAATAAKQDATNSYLSQIQAKIDKLTFDANNNLKVIGDFNVLSEVEIKNDSGNPVPISATSLPLPNGAATSVNQDITNAYLNSINNKISNLEFENNRLKVEIKNDTYAIPVNIQNPNNLATSDNQIAINNNLSTLNDKVIKVDTDNVKVIEVPSYLAKESKQDIQINHLNNILNTIGEVQETPTQYTLLDRIKSIFTALYDIFNGSKILGWIKNRPDYPTYSTGVSGYDVLVYGPYNLGANASTNFSITVPNGERWHIVSIRCIRRIIGGANTLASRYTITWDPTGTNKIIDVIYTDGTSNNFVPGFYSILGNGTRVLRVDILNGGTAGEHYFVLKVFREIP